MNSYYPTENQGFGQGINEYGISGYKDGGITPVGGCYSPLTSGGMRPAPPPPPPPPGSGGMLPPPPPPPPGYYSPSGYQPPGYCPPSGYPPINLPPVKPYPPDPYIDQFPLPEALAAGTLFRWLYDPYVDPYRT